MARKIGNYELLSDLNSKQIREAIRGTKGTKGTPGPKGMPPPGIKGWYALKEQQKQKNMNEIIKALVVAIEATGRPFKDIPKNSITEYLSKIGIDRSQHNDIYDSLKNHYNKDSKTKPSGASSSTNDFTNKNTIDSYNKDLESSLRKKEPRKNIFSEITKIH